MFAEWMAKMPMSGPGRDWKPTLTTSMPGASPFRSDSPQAKTSIGPATPSPLVLVKSTWSAIRGAFGVVVMVEVPRTTAEKGTRRPSSPSSPVLSTTLPASIAGWRARTPGKASPADGVGLLNRHARGPVGGIP